MRNRSLFSLLLLGYVQALTAAEPPADLDAWLEEDFVDVSQVNEGELEILAEVPPGGPFHHHQNILRITPDSLRTGWIHVSQCHDHLDPVPLSEIRFRRDRIRNIRVTRHQGIAKAWADDFSVQLETVSRDATLCLDAELKLLKPLNTHRYQLSSGPYMRRFLDGYYPMRVSLSVVLSGLKGTLQLRHPQPQTGLNIQSGGHRLDIETLFAGRLDLNIELQLKP